MKRGRYTVSPSDIQGDERMQIALGDHIYAMPGIGESDGQILLYVSTEGDPFFLGSVLGYEGDEVVELSSELQNSDDLGLSVVEDFFPELQEMTPEDDNYLPLIEEALMDRLIDARILE